MGQKFKAERSLRNYMKMVKNTKQAVKGERKKTALSGAVGLERRCTQFSWGPLTPVQHQVQLQGSPKDAMTFPLVLLNTLYPMLPPTANEFLMGVQ